MLLLRSVTPRATSTSKFTLLPDRASDGRNKRVTNARLVSGVLGDHLTPANPCTVRARSAKRGQGGQWSVAVAVSQHLIPACGRPRKTRAGPGGENHLVPS